ncbi:uncharacterized protein DS421_7g207700 [Arachis hypogaea]|nr:uncharacterized protein DS421_7g207700 [Arachis hypogaea]
MVHAHTTLPLQQILDCVSLPWLVVLTRTAPLLPVVLAHTTPFLSMRTVVVDGEEVREEKRGDGVAVVVIRRWLSRRTKVLGSD